MGFVLTEEQQMLRDGAMSFLAEKAPVTQLRQLRKENGGAAHDPALWAEMAGLGFSGVLVPEEFGGVGLGHVALGQILEAQGRTLAVTPLLQTALIGASALAGWGTDAQKAAYLPGIASGELLTALALDEGAHHHPEGAVVSANPVDGGFLLQGVKRFVPDGASANLLIVVARVSGQPGETHGLTLFLVPADASNLTRKSVAMMDYHPAAHISLDGVFVPSNAVLGEVDGGWKILEPLLDQARAGVAAELLGLSAAAFDMTGDYLKVRKQFGQLIGSFQSLQHRAAIMFTDLELTRSCVAAALDAIDAGASNTEALASLAKARASDLAHLLTNETVQMHGGIGMTDAHDAGFYIKRARVLEALYGGAGYHRDRYARFNGF